MKSVCLRGHVLIGDNLYEHNGVRYCNICRREATKRWRCGEAVPQNMRVKSSNKLVYGRQYEKAHKYNRNGQRSHRKTEIRLWYAAYKAQLCCIRCGEHHHACLTFHHRDPDEKHLEVSKMVQWGCRVETLLNEMAKCDVLCANCHFKLHFSSK